MKRVIVILLLVAAVACDRKTSDKVSVVDSTAVSFDSTEVGLVQVDSVKVDSVESGSGVMTESGNGNPARVIK